MSRQVSQSLFTHISRCVLVMIFLITLFSSYCLIQDGMNDWIINQFAFVPHQLIYSESYRLVSYGFIHSDFSHLGMNMLWLLIFATPLARHFKCFSFIFIFFVGIIAGGAVFIGTKNSIILIGASAGVSACMGASLRFMLKPAYDLNGKIEIYRLTDGRFLQPSIIFLIMDIANAALLSNLDYNISWQSHVIGYVVGALLMELRWINHGALRRAKLTSAEERYDG